MSNADRTLLKALEREDKASEMLNMDLNNFGRVLSMHNGVLKLKGLNHARPGMVLNLFEGIKGVVMKVNIDGETTVACLDYGNIHLGSTVQFKPDLKIPFLTCMAGPDMIGRTIDALGNPLDGLEPYRKEKVVPLPIFDLPKMTRHPMERFGKRLHCGIKSVDLFYPISRGRKYALVGDNFQRKSELAIDIACGLIEEHDEDERGLDLIYVTCGKTVEETMRLEDLIERSGAIEYTTIIRATERDTPAMQYLTVFAASAIADFHRARGRHVLLIVDNICDHNNITAKIMRDARGLTVYGNWYGPMMDRAGLFKKEYGGGSVTQIFVADKRDDRGETGFYLLPHVLGSVDTVINMDQETFEKGIFPAISLIPVPFGSPRHQQGALRDLAAQIRHKIVSGIEHHNQAMAQEDAGFEFDDLELEDDDKYLEMLKIRKLFTQFKSTSYVDTVIIMSAASDASFLSQVNLGKLPEMESKLLEFFENTEDKFVRQTYEKLENLAEDDPLTPEFKQDIALCLAFFIDDHSYLGEWTEIATLMDENEFEL